MAWKTVKRRTNADVIREARQRALDVNTRLGLRLIGETVLDGSLVLTFDDGSHCSIPLPDPSPRPY